MIPYIVCQLKCTTPFTHECIQQVSLLHWRQNTNIVKYSIIWRQWSATEQRHLIHQKWLSLSLSFDIFWLKRALQFILVIGSRKHPSPIFDHHKSTRDNSSSEFQYNLILPTRNFNYPTPNHKQHSTFKSKYPEITFEQKPNQYTPTLTRHLIKFQELLTHYTTHSGHNNKMINIHRLNAILIMRVTVG